MPPGSRLNRGRGLDPLAGQAYGYGAGADLVCALWIIPVLWAERCIMPPPSWSQRYALPLHEPRTSRGFWPRHLASQNAQARVRVVAYSISPLAPGDTVYTSRKPGDLESFVIKCGATIWCLVQVLINQLLLRHPPRAYPEGR